MKRTATNGVLQDPHQLSGALMHFARSPLRVHTYLEVGVWSAWTNALMSAFLARLARGRHEFRGYACDRWDKYVSGDTRKVLKALNVSFVLRNEADYAALVADDATRAFIVSEIEEYIKGESNEPKATPSTIGASGACLLACRHVVIHAAKARPETRPQTSPATVESPSQGCC